MKQCSAEGSNIRIAAVTLLLGSLLSAAVGSAKADEIDDFLQAQMRVRKIPGLQVAVVQDNTLIKFASYGLANLQDSVSVSDQTVFTINSMTKSFAGVAIMQLVEQGKLTLSDTVGQHLDDLPASWANVTVKQLLTHTSGLPDISGKGVYVISLKDADTAWQTLLTQPLDFEAGSEFRYNQTNYVLLGKIIDKTSGMRFVDFIVQRQLRPVSMTKTEAAGFAHFQDVIPHQARGYTYQLTGSLTTVYSEFPPYLRASAGMSASADELARWVIALNTGELLQHSASVAALWTPGALADGKSVGFDRFLNGYALGWQVIDRPEHRAIASVGGNRAAIMIYPDDDLAIVVLTNLMGASPERFIDEIAGFYLDDMQSINGLRLSEAELRPLLGEYDFGGFSITVSLEGNALSMLASGAGQEAFAVYARSNDEFFAKVIEASFLFERDAQGKANGLIFQQGETERLGRKL